VFDHVAIRVSDRDESMRFYDTVLATLGVEKSYDDGTFAEWGDFSLAETSDDRPVSKRLHIAFTTRSREQVEAFWQAGVDAGFESDGDPGPRPQYLPDYYGGFLLDPDGNSAEAVTYGGIERRGMIDHIWIRVANVAASRRFYETVAPHGGFRLDSARTDHVRFVGAKSSFSIRQGRPSEHIHFAFPASDNATVDAFHQAMLEAGYRDNGGPRERPEYHPGYYGAYVLDLDGNNVEVVNHNRG
jgi:catechol 2,3-dioxygenase-like lactoylglutathione lyase family enzyme